MIRSGAKVTIVETTQAASVPTATSEFMSGAARKRSEFHFWKKHHVCRAWTNATGAVKVDLGREVRVEGPATVIAGA